MYFMVWEEVTSLEVPFNMSLYLMIVDGTCQYLISFVKLIIDLWHKLFVFFYLLLYFYYRILNYEKN